MEVNRQDILKMFAYHPLCDSLKSNSRKIKMNQIKDGERQKGGGAKIPLKRSVLNANHGAYRGLSGLIGFGRSAEFGLYRPRLLLARPALAQPMAYRPAYRRPGPLGTLEVRWKVPKGGSSGETAIPWQPIGIEPRIAKT